MTKQLRTPNPNIPCRPGWCLQYVREAFGIYPGVYPSATAGWNASKTKHRDQNFPSGVWLPLWFFMANEPLGHVVLRAPNGSIYSTSDPSTVPHHHPNLADLMAYYAYYGLPLTYLGWTEDIENVRVVELSESIDYAGSTKPYAPQEDELSQAEVNQIKDHINDIFLGTYAWDGRLDNPGLGKVIIENQKRITASLDINRRLLALVEALPTNVWWNVTVEREDADGNKYEVPALQELANIGTHQGKDSQVLLQISGRPADQVAVEMEKVFSELANRINPDEEAEGDN